MLSDNNHIDQFFRNKEQETGTDPARMENDWQQMKELMALSLPSSKTTTMTSSPAKKIMAYAASILLLVALSVVLAERTGKKQNKKDTVTTQPVKKTGKENILPVTPSPGIENKVTEEKIVVNQKNNKNDIAFVKMNLKKTIIQKTLSNDTIKNIVQTTIPVQQEDAKKVYESFYAKLEKPAQQFTINNQADTLIICEEGTKLFIPAGSFQTSSGAAVTTMVTISIKEFYSFADILGQKLTTTSNGRALETGGMVNIMAAAGSMPVMIRPGRTLELKMPARSFDADMQLFTGQNASTDKIASSLSTIAKESPNVSFTKVEFGPAQTGIEWTEAGQRQYFYANNKKEITLFNTTDNPYEITNYRNNTKTMAKFAIPYSASISTEEMKTLLEEKYSKYYDKIKVKRVWRSWIDKQKELKWNNQDKKDKDRVKNDWYSSRFVGDSIRMPLRIARLMKLITVEDSLAYEAKFEQQLEEAIKQKRSYAEFLEKKKEYTFSIGNLGWINCDRFMDYPKSRLTAFIVNPGPGFEGVYMNAVMVFTGERAAMPGYMINGKLTFPNIPLGHQVTIICAGVKDGKMYTAVQPAVIDRKEMNSLVFETSNPEDFRTKLSLLGSAK